MVRYIIIEFGDSKIFLYLNLCIYLYIPLDSSFDQIQFPLRLEIRFPKLWLLFFYCPNFSSSSEESRIVIIILFQCKRVKNIRTLYPIGVKKHGSSCFTIIFTQNIFEEGGRWVYRRGYSITIERKKKKKKIRR